jgi:hypothetical protein
LDQETFRVAYLQNIKVIIIVLLFFLTGSFNFNFDDKSDADIPEAGSNNDIENVESDEQFLSSGESKVSRASLSSWTDTFPDSSKISKEYNINVSDSTVRLQDDNGYYRYYGNVSSSLIAPPGEVQWKNFHCNYNFTNLTANNNSYAIKIDNTGNSNDLLGYAVSFKIDTQTLISNGWMRPDCGDIRFYNYTGAEQPYWIESGINTPQTEIWVNVSKIPGSSITPIIMKFGNLSLQSQSNGTRTFEVFDSFEDTQGWNSSYFRAAGSEWSNVYSRSSTQQYNLSYSLKAQMTSTWDNMLLIHTFPGPIHNKSATVHFYDTATHNGAISDMRIGKGNDFMRTQTTLNVNRYQYVDYYGGSYRTTKNLGLRSTGWHETTARFTDTNVSFYVDGSWAYTRNVNDYNRIIIAYAANWGYAITHYYDAFFTRPYNFPEPKISLHQLPSITFEILNADDDSVIMTVEDGWDISGISDQSIKLKAEFLADGDSSIILNDWGVDWNTLPTLENVMPPPSTTAYRTTTIPIRVNLSDAEEPESALALNVQYKSPTDTNWQTQSLTGLSYNTDHWLCFFTPTASAKLGWYTFNFSFYDEHNFLITVLKVAFIKILNNNPIIHDITHSAPYVNRTKILNIVFNSSDIETPALALVLTVQYKAPSDLLWRTEYLSPVSFINGKWSVDFLPPKHAQLGQYVFRVICNDTDSEVSAQFNVLVNNNYPSFFEIISSSYQVKRTETVKILLDVSDEEKITPDLVIGIRYRAPTDTSWKMTYISNLMYMNGKWEAEFTPTKTAELGLYILNFSCNDGDCEVYDYFELTVLNNIPSQPSTSISPDEPKTTDDLEVSVISASDVETPRSQLEYWHYWYKDDTYLPAFDNMTKIPNTDTTKGEVWRCRTFVFDGDDLGPGGESRVTILNTPPAVAEPFSRLIMLEDEVDDSSIDLGKIFSDADNDPLTYTSTGQVRINVNINKISGRVTLTPPANWFGEETLEFTTGDGEFFANIIVVVSVLPLNDPPELKKAGTVEVMSALQELEFSVNEDNKLDLTFITDDIDGDRVTISTNRTDFIGVDDIEEMLFNNDVLSFYPVNSHVGSIAVNISLSDLNGSIVYYDLVINVLNTNDPPGVEITYPSNNTRFEYDESKEFKCTYSDIDFLIPDSEEILHFTWSSNLTAEPLGEGFNLTNLNVTQLTPGYHGIKVVVRDRGGLTNEAGIIIFVKEKVEDEGEAAKDIAWDLSSNLWWILIVIVVIIIAVIAFVFVIKKRKAVKAEVEHLPPAEAKPALPGTFVAKPGAISAPTVDVEQVPARAVTEQLPATAGAIPRVITVSVEGGPAVQPAAPGIPTPSATPPKVIPKPRLPPATKPAVPEQPPIPRTKPVQPPTQKPARDGAVIHDADEVR